MKPPQKAPPGEPDYRVPIQLQVSRWGIVLEEWKDGAVRKTGSSGFYMSHEDAFTRAMLHANQQEMLGCDIRSVDAGPDDCTLYEVLKQERVIQTVKLARKYDHVRYQPTKARHHHDETLDV